jgi:hypothetical protein
LSVIPLKQLALFVPMKVSVQIINENEVIV